MSRIVAVVAERAVAECIHSNSTIRWRVQARFSEALAKGSWQFLGRPGAPWEVRKMCLGMLSSSEQAMGTRRYLPTITITIALTTLQVRPWEAYRCMSIRPIGLCARRQVDQIYSITKPYLYTLYCATCLTAACASFALSPHRGIVLISHRCLVLSFPL